MYLSRLTLNPRHAAVLRALSDLYAMHLLLWQAFPDMPKREANKEEDRPHPLLYRVEPINRDGLVRVLAQSEAEPDWRALRAIPGLLCAAEQREYAPELREGQWLHYRLRANPVFNLRQEGEKRGKRQGLLTEREQAQWLQRQGTVWGFTLPTWEDQDGENRLDARIVPLGMVHGVKERRDGAGNLREKHVIKLLGVDYEGLLRITDSARFGHALRRGIGTAKGLGFGLLSVARASG